MSFGDQMGKRLVDAFRKIGPFRGVYGNIDGPDVRKELPAIDIIQAEDFMIGVNHPAEGGSPLTLEQRLRPKFPGIHAIIHGHVIGRRTIFRTVFSGSSRQHDRKVSRYKENLQDSDSRQGDSQRNHHTLSSLTNRIG